MQTVSTAFALILALGMVDSAGAVLVVNAEPTPPLSYAISVTTDDVFDTIQIQVDGDVVEGLNIVPDTGGFFGKAYVDISTNTALTALGTNAAPGGVFDPGLNADIDLTYGVTQPVGGAEWTAGLTEAPFLEFVLLTGAADVTVNLLRGGALAATNTITVTAIPEPTLFGAFAVLGASVWIRPRRVPTGTAG